jgi:hypothetical protein
MFLFQVLKMSCLSAADDEFIFVGIKPFTNIAKTNVVVPTGVLPDKPKSDSNSAPGINFS